MQIRSLTDPICGRAVKNSSIQIGNMRAFIIFSKKKRAPAEAGNTLARVNFTPDVDLAELKKAKQQEGDFTIASTIAGDSKRSK